MAAGFGVSRKRKRSVKVRWRVREAVAVSPELREAVGGHPLLAELLAQRGVTDPEAARRFLDPARYQPVAAHSLPGVCAATRALGEAALTRAPVRIWGDLDADGQTATAVLYEALTALGCRVDYCIPTRALGHGFPPDAVRAAAADGIRLIVTCDTGVSDVETVALANELGVGVIITDHHDLGEVLPAATAIINPKLLPEAHPARELAGVGVAYVVACALLDAPRFAVVRETMLDLVALGLVGDVATQVGDVRYWIQLGIQVLRRTRRPGLIALMRAAGIDPSMADEGSIGYQLAPRLNAVGRLGDANRAVELLLTPDAERAAELANAIDSLNADRRGRTEAAYARVDELVQRDPEALRNPAIVVAAHDLEEGVIGLVAGKLAQAYGRPAIVVAHREGKPSVGSARSVEGIDIHEAIATQRALLLREGGHPMAAGFALEPGSFETFRQNVLGWLREHAPTAAPEPVLEVDAVIPWSEAGLALALQLERLRPFGAGNPAPVLAAEGGVFLRAEDVSRWRETAHRRLFVSGPGGEPHRLMWFNAGSLPEPGDAVDVAFALHVNRYGGREEAQLTLEAWRPAQPQSQAVAQLVDGIEVVDWRGESPLEALLSELSQELGDDLLLYPAPADALTPHIALALTQAPPGPRELDALLAAVKPQVLYLLPTPAPEALDTTVALQRVAGMVKLAIAQREGHLDLSRMANILDVSEGAVAAALSWLEASGKVGLVRSDGEMRALHPGDAPHLGPSAGGATPDAPQAFARLCYLLGETAAYRRAWMSLPVTSLLHRER
jgi:single-stranded-DNA-specific exonuclease